MKTFTGKELKKYGKWYPITIQAKNLKEANQKVNKTNHSGDAIRGRFAEEKIMYFK